MQNFGKWIGAGAIAMASLTTLAGCPGGATDAGNAVDSTVSTAAESVSNVANAAAGTASNAVADVNNAAVNVGNSVSGAVSNTVNAATGMMKTPEIKAKIVGNPALNNPKNEINVDSDATTVTLNGKVQSAAQKTLAESIAKQNAGGRTVKNNLTVVAGKM